MTDQTLPVGVYVAPQTGIPCSHCKEPYARRPETKCQMCRNLFNAARNHHSTQASTPGSPTWMFKVSE